MDKWIFSTKSELFYIALSAFGIYLTVILYTRIFGKRSFSKMSSFDFACTIAVESIIASTLLSLSVSRTARIRGLFFIYFMQSSGAHLRMWKWFQRMVDNEPRLLMDGNEFLNENMRKAKVIGDDIRAKLREANIIELNEIRAVIFETTRDMAVLHTGEEDKRIDPYYKELKNNRIKWQ